MPVWYEDVDTTITSEFRAASKFVYVYPESNSHTPLGPNWQFGPCFLPEKSRQYMDVLENYEVRPDDIWSVTFAKAGSTWTQEMIWLLTNNLDYKRAKKSVFERFPYVEFDLIYEKVEKNVIEYTNAMPSPRYLKTHLPAGLLPKQLWTVKPKIIYTARGLKDLAISFYHHMVHIQGYKCGLDDFLDAFLENKMFLCPYHSNEKDFWYLRNEKNILFLRYEEMKKDLLGVIEKTAEFLGKSYSEKELFKLADHLSFDSMKESSSFDLAQWVGTKTDFRFIRKGIVGSYREEMSQEYIDKFDEWTHEYNQQNGTCIIP
ncbi:Luciferin sulfotransferase [Pseudolycoriella hygida]|uniref:Luciferin sulfotransferase n=1 Tax=Pseudolycoriella hygida TaxID=35572 RepID=A0A9Q0MX42_9DIPT|nr:Luciferin sulfotransferase [Pseudolycoriella hygida]